MLDWVNNAAHCWHLLANSIHHTYSNKLCSAWWLFIRCDPVLYWCLFPLISGWQRRSRSIRCLCIIWPQCLAPLCWDRRSQRAVRPTSRWPLTSGHMMSWHRSVLAYILSALHCLERTSGVFPSMDIYHISVNVLWFGVFDSLKMHISTPHYYSDTDVVCWLIHHLDFHSVITHCPYAESRVLGFFSSLVYFCTHVLLI